MEYQLIRIDHYRCDEVSAYTYALAPKEWSREDVATAANRAQDEYLKAVQNQVELPPYPHPMKIYEANPDKTVAEVKQMVKEAQEAYKDAQRQRWHNQRKFDRFLIDEGFIELDEGASEFELEWGHRHGQQLNYQSKRPVDSTLPAQARGDEASFMPFGEAGIVSND